MSQFSYYINSFGALHKTGIYSSAGHSPWEQGQDRIEDIRRNQVLDKPYFSFGKLQIADKLAFSASSLLFKESREINNESTGICIGAPYGSLSTDIKYMQSLATGFPSPALFSATLPSSAIADIAIYYGCKGPNRVVTEGRSSGLAALNLALMILKQNKAENVIVISLSALDPEHHKAPLLPEACKIENAAFAFLISKKPEGNSENSFKITLNLGPRPDKTAKNNDELYFYELVSLLTDKKSGKIKIDTREYSGELILNKGF